MAASLGSPSLPGTPKLQPRKSCFRTCTSHLLLASSHRYRTVVCQGLALPDGLHWPFWETFQRLFRAQKQNQIHSSYTKTSNERAALLHAEQPAAPKSIVGIATAIHAGLRLTGIALHLAKTVMEDIRKSLRFLRLPKASNEARASQIVADAKAKLQQKLRRENLQQQGKDTAFMQMLQCLDRCHIDHDAKWALFTQHTADKAEFCERWQHLYHLAKESKVAVDTLLRPDASRIEINKFWRSPETSAIIAEEDALKQLVFAQVLQAGSAY